MPLHHHHFIDEISRYKLNHGVGRNDDHYRRKLWLSYAPTDQVGRKQRNLRQNWAGISKPSHQKDHILKSKKYPQTIPFDPFEKPTRTILDGKIFGVADHKARFVNRGPPVASEYQGVRDHRGNPICPEYPRGMPEKTANYVKRKIGGNHKDCVDVYKNSTTLCRDMMNADLDYRPLSRVYRWYHDLVESADDRFDERWPEWRKRVQPDEFCEEYLALHRNNSDRLFNMNWVDEQINVPFGDHEKV